MRKYIKIEFAPFIGVGIATQCHSIDGKQLLLFVPFITIELTFRKKKRDFPIM